MKKVDVWHNEDPTGMKSVTVDENKSRVFDVFDRTAVRVVEDGTISNRQSEHFDAYTSLKQSRWMRD
jgi:hypothetical protein